MLCQTTMTSSTLLVVLIDSEKVHFPVYTFIPSKLHSYPPKLHIYQSELHIYLAKLHIYRPKISIYKIQASYLPIQASPIHTSYLPIKALYFTNQGLIFSNPKLIFSRSRFVITMPLVKTHTIRQAIHVLLNGQPLDLQPPCTMLRPTALTTPPTQN